MLLAENFRSVRPNLWGTRKLAFSTMHAFLVVLLISALVINTRVTEATKDKRELV